MIESLGWKDASLQAIVECLADGGYHSGEQLGRLLGVSRAAVWKQLQKLGEWGIAIESVKGRGYSIPGGLDLLVADEIISHLSSNVRSAGIGVEIFSVIDSTNAYLLRTTPLAGRVCLAELQTSGRGRRGRRWHSPFAQNIYLSIGWAFESGVAALEGLSLALGVGIARALKNIGIDGVGLKWPNDVLYDDKKVAGILIEMRGDPVGLCEVVVGVGVNVRMPSATSVQIDQPWIDLAGIATAQGISLPPRNSLCANLISELVQVLDVFSRQGFSAYQNEWQLLACYMGQQIILHNGEMSMIGTMRGVNHQGALKIETSDGARLVFGGEVSLRAAS